MKIDMTEVNENKTTLTTSIDNLNSQLETAKTSFTNLVNTDSLQGEVKTAIDGKINNYQIPLLTNFSNSLSTLSAQYDKAIEAFQTTVEETSATAIIDTDYLQGLEEGYSTIESSIATIDSETSKIYSSISDIISLSNPSSSDITTPLSEAKKVLTDTKSNMETFNGWTQGTEFSELLLAQSTQLQSLMGLVNISYTASGAKTFYNKTDFADNAAYVAQAISNQSTPVGLLANVGKHTSSFFDFLGDEKCSIVKDLLAEYTKKGLEKTGTVIQTLAGHKLLKYGVEGSGFVMIDPDTRLGSRILTETSKKNILGSKIVKWGEYLGGNLKDIQFKQGWGTAVTGIKSNLSSLKSVKGTYKSVGAIGTLFAVTDGIDTYIQNKETYGEFHAAIDGIAHAGSSFTGAVVGAQIGAVIGSAIPIPVVGTVVGAAIGSIAGSAVSDGINNIWDNVSHGKWKLW
ncbi:T7SS effector LXG polymorphic toxin [Streptococcus pantholopis]|uniref:LXG domain-containing protein n=2 Tax=Streptococcus TaxID=1301 RepID=A0A172Q647_9STRE|nr:T7SS effector LXG polymorphic toxin [Streptococcus pantholopis]AND78918.1 hypothetical protein A0O21_02210 [Streptococcus pantholopis]